MKYGIIANPISGPWGLREKKRRLEKAKRILGDCIISGFETKSKKEFCEEAIRLSKKVDVLIVAGGDGSFIDVVNAVDLDKVILSYIPLGSGNALKYAMKLPYSITKIAEKIKNGEEHRIDLISYENKKTLFASIGASAVALKERERFLEKRIKGFWSYLFSGIYYFLKGVKRINAKIILDDEEIEIKNIIFMIITKIPFWGYNLKLTPLAKKEDGKVHLYYINSRFFGTEDIVFTLINPKKLSKHKQSQKIEIITDKETEIEICGNSEASGRKFTFEIIPQKLKIWY